LNPVAKLDYQTPPQPPEPPLPLERVAEERLSNEPVAPAAPVARGGSRPTPAPPWVALLTAWLGLVVLIASVVFIFLPGSADPQAELKHARDYSPADKFLPFPIYGVALALFLGIVVLWQMRRESRPLPPPMVAQRVQAWVGIVLALLSAVVIYTWVALRGPR
jgi:hypothetical protein